MGSRTTPPRVPKSRFRLKTWPEWFAAVARHGSSSAATPPLSAYGVGLALSDERRERWFESSEIARWVAERPKAHAEARRSEAAELSPIAAGAESSAGEAALLDALSSLYALLALPAYDDATREERLTATLEAARRVDFGIEPESPIAAATSLIVGAELPLLAAVAFPDLEVASELGALGAKHASALIDERFDGDGQIAGRLAAEYPAIAASLLRIATIALSLPAKRAERKWLNDERRHQIEMLAWQMWRLLRADGTLSLPDVYGRVRVLDAIDFAAGIARDPEEAEALTRLAARMTKGKPEKRSGTLIVDPMAYSGWAEQVVLRTNEKLAAPRFVADFAERRFVAELLERGEPILTGPIETTASLDGEPAPQEGDWQEVCWHSDDDGDYLELEAAFARGIRVQRQLYLDRQEQIFLLADAVLLATPGALEYDVRWTAAPKVLVQSFDETSELVLDGPATATTLIPAAASEWRTAPSACRVHVETALGREALRMSYRGKGDAAFVPWVFHFTGSRRGIPLTWRRLTVVEDREPVPSDQAAGFRVQVGDDQWLIYRSLDGLANRTLLGQNLVSEFYVARFLEDGAVEKMLELQPDGDGG